MKVRFVTKSSGPEGTIRPGDVVDVSAREAELLVKGRFATYVDALPTASEPAARTEAIPEKGADPPARAQKKTGGRARKA